MAATDEEPYPAVIDPRGKESKVNYRPPMLKLTATQKKGGPRSTRSNRRKINRASEALRKTFAQDAIKRQTFNPYHINEALSNINLQKLDQSIKNDSPSRNRSFSPARSLATMKRYKS